MGLFVRTIGIARATATVTLVNMAYNCSDGAGSMPSRRPPDEALRPAPASHRTSLKPAASGS